MPVSMANIPQMEWETYLPLKVHVHLWIKHTHQIWVCLDKMIVWIYYLILVLTIIQMKILQPYVVAVIHDFRGGERAQKLLE